MKGNQGFTLVELVVSLAILGILAVAEITFMSSGSNAYRSVYGNVNLQVESQTVMNQLEDYVISCNGGFAFQNNTLYVVDSKDSGYDEYVFAFDPDARQINYSHYEIAVSGGTPNRVPAESGLMAGQVNSFNVTFQPGAGNVASVKIDIGFAQQGTVYTTGKTVAPRNSPPQEGSEADLIQNICK